MGKLLLFLIKLPFYLIILPFKIIRLISRGGRVVKQKMDTFEVGLKKFNRATNAPIRVPFNFFMDILFLGIIRRLFRKR